MSKNAIALRAEFTGNKVFLMDPDNVNARIEVDQVIVDGLRVGRNFVEGYVVSVHGFPQEIAETLPQPLLHAVGVGNHLGIGARFRKGVRRYVVTPTSVEQFRQ